MNILNNKLCSHGFLIIFWITLIQGLWSSSLVFAEENFEAKDNILEKIKANPFGMEKSIAIDIDPGFLSGSSQLPSSSFALEPEDLMDQLRNQLIDAGLVDPAPAFAIAADIKLAPISLEGARRIKQNINDHSIKMRTWGKSGAVRMLRGKLLKKTEMAANGFGADIQSNTFSREEQDKMLGRNFLNTYKDLLRINNPEAEFKFIKRQEDELKRCHLRYSQMHKGIPVWPAELIVHLDPEGDVDLMTGTSIPSPQKLVTTPSIDIDQAIYHGISAITDSELAEISEPQLIIYAPVERMPRLAWKMEVNISLTSSWLVMVDAHTGRVLNTLSQVYDANVTGSGTDLFGVDRQLNLWEENGVFYMVDTSKPMFKLNSNPPELALTRGGIIILDAKNKGDINDNKLILPTLSQVTSQNPNSFWLPDAVSASFGLSETYDYFRERHQRDSLDGKGGTMTASVRFAQDIRNAFWHSSIQIMIFGDGLPYAGALDMVAHELTHGVTNHSANLEYQNQSGALNEAFSDIFGEMVEARTKGFPDWLTGSDLGEPLRNMRDPSSLSIGNRRYPSKMSQFIRPDDPFLDPFDNRDSGGVHINSSIINHTFYLLAEGLPGAIGIRDAERIFYRTLTTKLQSQSQFLDARRYAIISAEELFPDDPSRAKKVSEAFDAVEIFDNELTPEPVPTPTNSGPDSTLSIFASASLSSYILFRNEDALGDSSVGESLSFQVAPKRPSVTGDGSIAAFIDAQNDLCFTATDDSSKECLGYPGLVHSVALSPDRHFAAFVFLDDQGEPEKSITIVDLNNNTNQTFPLQAPLIDGGTIDVTRADVLDFTIDGKSLVYDAFNVINFADGTSIGLWSIYRIDLENETVNTLIPPIRDLNIGNPSLGQTKDHLLTFDVLNLTTDLDLIFSRNLFTGETAVVADVQSPAAPFYPSPVYTGDDSAIIYTVKGSVGYSLRKQPLQSDHVTPDGPSSLWLSSSALGVIYRRGEFEGIVSFGLNVAHSGNGSGLVSSSPSGIICAEDCSEEYPKGTIVSLVANPNPGSIFAGWHGAGCSGTGRCEVLVDSNRSVTAEFSAPELSPIDNNLHIRAVIETVEKGGIEAVWSKGGEANTARGDKVIWGHFYASPADVSWGNPNNPELFVKIWFDISGRIDVNYFHVSVPRIQVHTSFSDNTSAPDQSGTTDMSRRYIRHFKNPDGLSFSEENFEDGVSPALDILAPDPSGFHMINNLKIGTQINTVEAGFLEGIWQLGGSSKTARGDEVVWGHFSANSGTVAWGNPDNPELFVKIWFDVSGRIDVNYFHVSVPDIGVFSDSQNDGNYDQRGVTILRDRYTRHEFHR